MNLFKPNKMKRISIILLYIAIGAIFSTVFAQEQDTLKIEDQDQSPYPSQLLLSSV
jgi:hypothetical protein